MRGHFLGLDVFGYFFCNSGKGASGGASSDRAEPDCALLATCRTSGFERAYWHGCASSKGADVRPHSIRRQECVSELSEDNIVKIVSLVRGAASEFFAGKGNKLQWLRLRLHILRSKVFVKRGNASSADYLEMQRRQYQRAAAVAEVVPGKIEGDYVAALDWNLHNNYPEYMRILKRLPLDGTLLALEYGCGPGRNIANWSKCFRRIDGVDISEGNLLNAKTYLSGAISADKQPQLFLTTGQDVGRAPQGAYDFAFSVICLQHICVYDIRKRILTSLYQALRPGGRIAIQLAFNSAKNPGPNAVPYYANVFDAGVTNGMCDCVVSDPEQVRSDFSEIGFVEFEAEVCPVIKEVSGVHPEWIFCRGRKPISE